MTRLGWLAVLCVAALAGCANETGEREASTVAARFLDAAGGGDTQTACALLVPKLREDLAFSEGQPCTESLPADRLRGAVRDADVWSDRAKVTTDAGTLFLAEFGSGWLITAAGCAPNGDAPYHCVVGG